MFFDPRRESLKKIFLFSGDTCILFWAFFDSERSILKK